MAFNPARRQHLAAHIWAWNNNKKKVLELILSTSKKMRKRIEVSLHLDNVVPHYKLPPLIDPLLNWMHPYPPLTITDFAQFSLPAWSLCLPSNDLQSGVLFKSSPSCSLIVCNPSQSKPNLLLLHSQSITPQSAWGAHQCWGYSFDSECLFFSRLMIL